MAAQKGRSYIVKLGDGGGPETFTTIGGGRSATITIGNTTVDATSKDDAGIRQLLEGAGETTVSIALSGVYVDDAITGTLRGYALANSHHNYQLVIPGSTSNGTYAGSFQIASFEEGGENNDVGTYSLTLESAGTVTYS